MSGWIKLYRDITKWEWYENLSVRVLFIHLLLKANHQPNKWQGRLINCGQVLTGRKVLAKETCLTEQQIRTALTKLKSTSEITIKTYSKYSVISINNWSEYQQSTSNLTNNQPATNQQLTTNKNVKKEKNVKNKYTSLKSLTDEVVNDVSQSYSVNPKSVMLIRDELTGWCEAKGKTYKNYKSALQNWVRRELKTGSIKKNEVTPKQDLPVISEVERQANLKKIQEIRNKF